jgi:DNA-directed RNA polymerase II subunit RPB2
MATPDITVSGGGKLLARYLQVTSCLDNNKIAYDAWVSRIGEQLEIRVEEISPGIFVIFTPSSIIPPMKPDEKNGIITPTIAREQKLNYTGEIKTHIKIVKNFDPKDPCSGEIIEQTIKPISVGKIHVMVKSVLCRLHGKSDVKLEAMSEDPRDPGGYVLVNGLSRTAPFNQQMRVDTFVLSADTSREPREPVCTITADTIRGTVITSTRIIYEKVSGSPISVPYIRLNLNNVRKKISSGGKKKVYYTFNIIRAIRYFASINAENEKENVEELLNFQDPKFIFDFILKLTKPKWRKKVKLAIIPTYIESLVKTRDEQEIADLIREKEGDVGYDSTKGIKYTINSSVVTYEDVGNYTGRIKTLCMMAAMLGEHEAGYRKMTNRDAWRNKRLVTLAKKCAQLLRGYFKNFTRSALSQQKGEKFSSKKNMTLSSIISNASYSHVTEGFQNSFTGPRWGVKTVNVREENPVNDLQMGSYMEMIAMLVRLNTTVDRKTKSFQLRGVQSDQWGFVDAHDSPESSAIGLVLELSITTSITVDKSASGVISILNGEIGVVMKEDEKPYKEKYIYDDVVRGEHENIVLVNGFFKGWCNGRKTLRALRFGKRQGLFDRQSCVVIDEYGYLIVHTDEGRLVRPLLIINEEGKLVIEEKKMWDSSIRELFKQGCMEYVDAHEQVYVRIAELPESLKEYEEDIKKFESLKDKAVIALNVDQKDKQAQKDLNYAQHELKILRANPFTHREIHSQAMFAPSLTTMPFLEYNQITRVSYQSHMTKQAIGTYSTAYERRFGDSKVLMRPSKPLVTTQLEPFLGLDKYPHGKMLEFAFLAIRGTTQEDAMIMNQNTVESGVLSMMTFTTIETMIETGEILSLPTKFKEGEDPDRYRYLTNQGLPMINSPLKHGYFVIGKIHISNEEGEKNLSVPVRIGQSGVVHRVFVTKFNSRLRVVVVLRKDRELQVGDKLSSRYAQKGTSSEIVPQKYLPFFEDDGSVPDIFVNPHSVPKRMTIGYVREALYGLLSALTGKRFNASPHEPNITDDVYRDLEMHGFKSKGYRWMVDPITGMRLKAMVFAGPVYIQLLSHLGPEKMQVRASGAVKLLTRQPPRGGYIGGRRVGEMERDAILSHGASNFLYERLITMSDAYTATFCAHCGDFAKFIINGSSGRGECRVCDEKGLPKDVRKKTIPYVYKLLVQLMMGAQILIRFDPTKNPPSKEDDDKEEEEAVEYPYVGVEGEEEGEGGKKDDSEEESEEESEVDEEESEDEGEEEV